MTALRLFNRETLRHSLWQGKLTDNVNSQVRLARIGIWQATANGLLFGTENILSIYLAVSFVLDGGFSIGMVFAYMAYKSQFMGTAASLVDQFIAFRMVRLHLERLSDIALTEEDVSFGPSEEAQTELQGNIELKDVRFRYSPSDPFVLDRLNLTRLSP
jgi:ATP-binding cassette subfamily B protein RaxB